VLAEVLALAASMGTPAGVVDAGAATYLGAGVGDRTRRLERLFGQPLPGENVMPPGVEYYDVGGPTSFTAPRRLRFRGRTWRYEGVSWHINGGRVTALTTVRQGARTTRGLTIGDPQARVLELYPDARCHTANEGTEWATFPLCEVRIRRGHKLWFGAEPVKSIWVTVETESAYDAVLRRRRG